MSPAQLSYQRYDNFLLGENFGKLHHPAQILLAKAWAILLNQLSRHRYDNLLTISGPFFAENFIDDPFANAPVKQGKAGGGTSQSDIARQLDLSLRTVQRWTRAGVFPERTPRSYRHSVDAYVR